MNILGTTIGVATSLLGSFAHSFGLTLQRKAHIQRQQKYSYSNSVEAQGDITNFKPPSLFKDKLWLTGFIIFIISSSVCPAIALVYLPVFVAAPLSAVNLAANTLCAGLVLHIKISFKEYVSTLLVTFGAIWIAIFATIPEKNRSLQDLLALYKRPVFVTYFTIYEVCVVSLILFELYLRRVYRRYRADLLQFVPENSQETTANSSGDPSQPTPHSATFSGFSGVNGEYTRLELERSASDIGQEGSSSGILTESLQNDCKSKSIDSLRSKSNEHTPLIKKTRQFGDESNFVANSQVDEDGFTIHSLLNRIPMRRNNSTISEIENSFYINQGTPLEQDLEALRTSPGSKETLEHIHDYENTSGLLSGFISGLICSQSILFTKTTVELLSLTLKGDNQFNDPLPWFLLFMLVATALGNLYYFNRGLRLTSTIVMIPLAFCSYTLSALVNSVIYYNQLGQLNPYQLVMSFIGFIIVFVGVGSFSSTNNSKIPK